MKDIQNIRGDFGYRLNKVGVSGIRHPMTVRTREGGTVATVGEFAMAVSLEADWKGINMSRLPILLSDIENPYGQLEDLRGILEAMRRTMESQDAFLDIAFDYFMSRKAPVSGFEGLMPYRCRIEASLTKKGGTDRFDYVLHVEVPITTLCPCSKEISAYSAHNQRGYVSVALRGREFIWIEEIVEAVEGVASCALYPILKRVDEKFVTERAYENPRFVEDIVRLAAARLDEDPRIRWFAVGSRHQESIHPHDAFAQIEVCKD